MTPCILTDHATDPDGYGRCNVVRYGKKINKTHVLAWVDAHGRLPASGQQINHHCDVRACRNVDHLYEGTQRENIRDAVERGRLENFGIAKKRAQTHCAQGHEFTPANTRIKANGTRACRTCHRENELRRYHRAQTP
jgi:hypothetical protein